MKKIKLLLILITFLIGVPIIIDLCFLVGQKSTIFITTFEASDVLQFYGIILAFLGTIYLGRISMKQNERIMQITEDTYNVNWRPTLFLNKFYIAESGEFNTDNYDAFNHYEFFTGIKFDSNDNDAFTAIIVIELKNYTPNSFLYKLESASLSKAGKKALFVKECEGPPDFANNGLINHNESLFLYITASNKTLNNSNGEQVELNFLLENVAGKKYTHKISFRLNNINISKGDRPVYNITNIDYTTKPIKNKH